MISTIRDPRTADWAGWSAKPCQGSFTYLFQLKDENRDYQMNNTEMIEVVNQLESRCQVLMDINQVQ